MSFKKAVVLLLFPVMLLLVPSAASAAPVLEISPAQEPYDFGQVRIDDSVIQTYLFENVGNENLQFLTFVPAGADQSKFQFDSTPCSPGILEPGDSCLVDVEFSPGQTGVLTGFMNISTNIGNFTPSYRGTGVLPPVFVASPDSHAFGNVNTGDSSVHQFSVDNGASLNVGQNLDIFDVHVDGPNSDQFEIISDTCSGSALEAQLLGCTVDVAFKPTQSGTKNASLVFPDNDSDPDTIPLSGTAVDIARATLSPSPFDFGQVILGANPLRQTFELTSTGTKPLNVSAVSLTGPDINQFQVTDDNCAGQQVAVAATCSVAVLFTPSGPGGKTGQLVFAHDGADSTTTVQIDGSAMEVQPPPPPNLALKLNGAGKVKRGKTLIIKATVKNTGGKVATSLVLKTKVPSKLALQVKPIKVAKLAPGASITRTIKVKVKKNAKKGKKLKVTVSTTATGAKAKSASKQVTIT